MILICNYLSKISFDVSVATSGGYDEQDKEGSSQHHLRELFLNVNTILITGSVTIETTRGCLSFAPNECFGQLLGIIRHSQFPPTNFPCYTLLRPYRCASTILHNGLSLQNDYVDSSQDVNNIVMLI